MATTLKQALETSQVLEERLASERDAKARDALEQKLAMVNFATFGMYKQALLERLGPEAMALGKGLLWGTGLGIPALGVGHLLARDARRQGEELVNHARNQALLTAMGVGGIQSVGTALSSALKPKQREEISEMTLPNDQSWQGRNVVKLSSDRLLQKIAATLLLDNVLENQVQKLANDERVDALECLFLNRIHGTRLLRELL